MTARPRPAAATLRWSAHHALMLLAMVPCLVPTLADTSSHAWGVALMLALCVDSTVRSRRRGATTPALLDDLAMLTLLIAGLLDGHAEHGVALHHGGMRTDGIGDGLGIAAAALWAACRAGTWPSAPGAGRGATALASLALSGAMVALMLLRLLGD